MVDINQNNIDPKSFINLLKNIEKYKLNVIWFFNKIDKAIFDMGKNSAEEIYQLLAEKID